MRARACVRQISAVDAKVGAVGGEKMARENSGWKTVSPENNRRKTKPDNDVWRENVSTV